MVDLWRMCVQSFVALCSVLIKPFGFLDPGELILTTRTLVVVWLFGSHLPCPKMITAVR